MTSDTPTPRTDAEKDLAHNWALEHGGLMFVPADFARQLERELAAAEAVIAQMREALKMLHDEMDDYQRINNLSAYDNHCMKLARDALALDSPSSALSSHVKQKQREVLEEFDRRAVGSDVLSCMALLKQMFTELGTQETTGTAK